MTAGVYFVRCEQFVKIGCSANIESRWRELQVGNPFELTLLAYVPTSTDRLEAVERTCHQRFKHLRVRGEWFRWTDELAEAVRREARPAPPKASRPRPDRRSTYRARTPRPSNWKHLTPSQRADVILGLPLREV